MRMNLFGETEEQLDAREEEWEAHCRRIGICEMWAESLRECSDTFDAQIIQDLHWAEEVVNSE